MGCRRDALAVVVEEVGELGELFFAPGNRLALLRGEALTQCSVCLTHNERHHQFFFST